MIRASWRGMRMVKMGYVVGVAILEVWDEKIRWCGRKASSLPFYQREVQERLGCVFTSLTTQLGNGSYQRAAGPMESMSQP